ncbi:MAG: SusC/RagA family TonB-linked outer membrane protein [Marinifilaceae bacterium]
MNCLLVVIFSMAQVSLCLGSTGLFREVDTWDGFYLINILDINENSKPSGIVSGRVVDIGGKGLEGVTIAIKNSNRGCVTNKIGEFKIYIDDIDNSVLRISYLGMETKEVDVRNSDWLLVRLSEIITPISEVVVTGMVEKKRESFTGSFATYTNADLKSVGYRNVIQCLKTLDPSFSLIESKQWGSDPNTLPVVEIRGKTSVAGLAGDYTDDPNRPLFILDGFEAGLETVINLNVNRIANVTILKDAASSAIYGAQAANGVVVIETVKPELGKLCVTYNGDFGLSIPHLNEYNLMNSREKLEFERLSGKYDANGNFAEQIIKDKIYNARLAEVLRGVDTYWLNEPLRKAFIHAHHLSVEGGENAIRYSLGLTYNEEPGVMKGSDHISTSGYANLIYRTKKILFSNISNLSSSNSEREPVEFSEFAQQNPYYRKFDENGNISMFLEYDPGQLEIVNPLYIMSLNNINRSKNMSVTNNSSLQINLSPSLMMRGRFSFFKTTTKMEVFKSPKHPDYRNEVDENKGRFTETNGIMDGYSSDIMINYGKLFAGKHLLTAMGTWSCNEGHSNISGYSVSGFMDELHGNPGLSSGFKENQKPVYTKTTKRSLNYLFSLNYSYDNRYVMDATFRSSGTSIFGANKRFTSTWSIGIAWNLHSEQFIRNLGFVDNFRIRASMGNPGNQNFDAYIAQKTYKYNYNLSNYFGVGAMIDKFGNKNLEWQTTMDRNIGLDLSLFDERIRIVLDCYSKDTDPLLIRMPVPPSMAATSISTNLGGLLSTGVNGMIITQLIKKQSLRVQLNTSFNTVASTYKNVGNKLHHLNQYTSVSTLQRYYEGGSPYDMWAVPSLGIDPTTGREVFLKKDGTHTFKYSIDDQVKVGRSAPKVDGIIRLSLNYKGLMAAASFRYAFGGQVIASALFNKVENISYEQLQYNQDKRALYDRWQKKGDVAKFKAINLVDATSEMSSRFVVDENILSGESFTLSYKLPTRFLEHLRIKELTISANMNDIFRISSFKEERGISYPFAKNVSWSISISI